MKITILDDYQDVIQSLDCFSLLAGYDVNVIHKHFTDEVALAETMHGTQILILNRTRTKVTRTLIEHLPDLKLISQTGKLAGHVDLEACNEHGVQIAEGRGNPVATAELTWSLILNGLCLLPQAIEGMKAGQWQSNLGDRVFEKTIGIWGYGKIGKRIAQYAKVFGAKVIVWGSENSRSQALADGFNAAATKRQFFQTSDVITMHLRLHPATTAIVTLQDLRLMKPTALFVNTARAALIAPNALLTALKEGNPGRAALDVYDQEPIFDPAHPLLMMENVICSPHLGYVERQGYELYYSIAFENVLNYLKGSPTGIKDF